MMKRILTATLILSIGIGLVGCGTEQEANQQNNCYGVFVSLGEGKWPVEGYQMITSEIMGIRFEYPKGWGGTISTFDSEEGECKEVFGDAGIAEQMPESVDTYIGVTVYRDSQIRDVTLPSSDELMETEKVTSIAGVSCIDMDYGLASDSSYFRSMEGNNGKYLVMVQFSFDAGRTDEEYRKVADRVIETFKIEFEQDP